MTDSHWANATAPDHIPLICPKCGALDLMNGASLTLERIQGGKIHCTVCSYVFYPPSPTIPPPKAA